MYEPGELIYCGRRGVCRLAEIEEIDGRPYYRLEPLFYSCTIHTPVNGKAFMRPALTRAQAEALIDRIPDVQAQPALYRSLRELSDWYLKKISTHDAAELVAMLMSIHAKQQLLSASKKKLGAIDERFMKEGESLLFGELGAALGIEPQDVPVYIQDRLGDIHAEN